MKDEEIEFKIKELDPPKGVYVGVTLDKEFHVRHYLSPESPLISLLIKNLVQWGDPMLIQLDNITIVEDTFLGVDIIFNATDKDLADGEAFLRSAKEAAHEYLSRLDLAIAKGLDEEIERMWKEE